MNTSDTFGPRPDTLEVGAAGLSALTAVVSDMLADGEAVRFTAAGRSMRPAIRDGDRLTVLPLQAARLKRGSVALYRRAGGLTAHRVLNVTPGGRAPSIRVRGDASRGRICHIPCTDVLGVVTEIERHGKTIPVDRPGRRMVGLLRALAGTWRVRIGRVLRRVR